MEYILPSLRIAQITGMADIDTVHERLAQLLTLEEALEEIWGLKWAL